MRRIDVSETEYWLIPDANIVVPVYDLFLDHFKTGETDGTVDTIILSGKEYKSVFYSGKARFYVGENLRFVVDRFKLFNGTVDPEGVDEDFSFVVWFGVVDNPRQLPAALFSENNILSLVPAAEPESFCINDGGTVTEHEDTAGFEIAAIASDFVTVWLGVPETVPEDAKIIRVLPVCDDDVKVGFILQNGEFRTWNLHIKRKSSEFRELTKFVKTNIEEVTANESSIEISDGENQTTTTLFISGLQKNELDEISQLAVSRYVEINGARGEVVRRSAIILGNSQGGSFSIDVKNL
jgi:hypothetical protein